MAQQKYRESHKEEIAAARKTYRRTAPGKTSRVEYKKTLVTKRMTHHSFLAIDGEGWTVPGGEHEYTMIVTSDPAHLLYTGKPLTTMECLAFIADLPVVKNRYIVSFYFDYDVTMILRDMAREDPELAAQLFKSGTDYVWWRGFGIKYRPHKNFTVKRWVERGNNAAVQIHDGQGFFQSSFVVALTKFKIGTPKQLKHIVKMKGLRGSFTKRDADKVIKYSEEECRLLVELMGAVRDLSHAAGINAEPYEGPGTLAGRAMTRHYGKEQHLEVLAGLPEELGEWGPWAMYGGRFEILAVGNIPCRVEEFDVHSAYPDEMSNLPCLVHGKWVRTRKVYPGSLTLSRISFLDSREPLPGMAYALPVRSKGGALHYPRSGSGWYWQHEYTRETLAVTVYASYTWKPTPCKCTPFGWINELYVQRQTMEGLAKGSGIVLKLCLNTLYGKCAQQKPVPGAWLNFIYASVITSKLRTRVYDLYLSLPERSVVMFATDAVFTVNDGLVDTSHLGLGGLEHAGTYHDMTIIQPGLYFDGESSHFKTRGIGKKYIIAHGAELRKAAIVGESVEMQVEQFKGLRLSLMTGNLRDMGNWITSPRTVATRTYSKRQNETLIDGITWTDPGPESGETVVRGGSTQADVTRYLQDLQGDDETATFYGDPE